MKHNKSLKILTIAVIVTMTLFLTGCDWLSAFMGVACDLFPDSSHCFQSGAVQGSNPDQCAKIKPPKEFEKTGSNPPKDKCYLMIAQNTGKYDICKNIKGGYGSYTQEECVEGIAVDRVDPSGCKRLTGAALTNCRAKLGEVISIDNIKTVDDEIKAIKDQLEDDPTDPDLKSKLNTLTGKRDELVDFANSGIKTQYTKSRVQDIMGDVEDEDVAKEIRTDYLKYKGQNPTANLDQLMDKLEKIKEEKEYVKNLDEQANQLMDTLKSSVTDYAQEQIDEKTGEIMDAATEKGWDWVKKNGGDNLFWQLKKLESMKDKYDKASEQYDKLNKQIAKIKGVYDEVSAVYKKVDQFNKMVKQGKITEGQANVLKGGVLLGRGLEYATSYIPVFGSTASTVTKETFEVAMKLAKQRAERTNAINKCIDDPEHCDTDAISGY